MKVLVAFCLCLGAAFASHDYERSCDGIADSGRCLAYFPMYYYDAGTDICKRFIYGGCGGNGNRYATEKECLQNCKGHSQNTEEFPCYLPPVEGKCRGYFPSYYFDAETATCRKMIYGGCGGNSNRFASEKDCYKRCLIVLEADKEKSCEGKGERGRCLAYVPMYYYDAETETCKRFIYGGCGGTGNRYITEDECMKNCKSSKRATDKSYSIKPETRSCRTLFHKYNYDANTGECNTFIYGGCGENGNRFDTEAQCKNACSKQRSIFTDCESEPETGKCKGSFTRYYYDKAAGECKEFIYGGCGGNRNNFLTKTGCSMACGRD